MPESPRWLVKVGREEEGRYILGRLRGTEGEDAAMTDAEFHDIVKIKHMEEETSHKTSYFHMFFGIGSGKLHIGRRVQLVIWLQILQEWIGIAGITIYGPTIFEIAGISAEDRLWVTGLNDITYMVCPDPCSLRRLTPANHANLVCNIDLCVHCRSYRSTLDLILGCYRPGYLHVRCRWTCPRYDECRPQFSRARRRCSHLLRLPVYHHFRRDLAYRPLAVSCRDIPIAGPCSW